MNCNLNNKEFRKETMRIGYISLIVAGDKRMKKYITIDDIYKILEFNMLFEEEYNKYN